MTPDPTDWWDALVNAAVSFETDLHGLARGLCRDRQQADDLVQEAIIRTYLARSADAPPPDLRNYLARAIINIHRSEGRRMSGVGRLLEKLSFDRAGPVLDNADSGETLLSSVQALPRRQREVILCRYWMDLTVDETATLLGIAPGTIKAHSHKAIRRLATEVSDVDT